MRILYYSPLSFGGIADYAHEQANALGQLGVEVDFLCTPDYPDVPEACYRRLLQLKELKASTGYRSKLAKLRQYFAITVGNYQTLARVIKQGGYQYVLLGSYAEYLAPFWAAPLRRLAREGVIFGAVVHDPVRDFILGPLWWHKWSVACGYSFLREAWVHEETELDTGFPMSQLHTTVIPHGPYHFPGATVSREEMRSQLNLPSDAKVLLAFGHLRANKNLDLVIEAMAKVPEVYLVVAGSELSGERALGEQYRALAHTFGVADRCRWQIRFIPKSEVANFFNASDLVALTYSRAFRSASGVLSTAAVFHKPCIASGGNSCLASIIHDYNLGIWIEPDQAFSIVSGLKKWLLSPPNSLWDAYLKDNTWERNAKLVLKTLQSE